MSLKMPPNVDGLLLGWHLKTSSPATEPS